MRVVTDMYPVTRHWAVSAVTQNASMMSMSAMLTMFSLNAATNETAYSAASIFCFNFLPFKRFQTVSQAHAKRIETREGVRKRAAVP